MRQYTGIRYKSQPFSDLTFARIGVILAHHHGTRAAASDDGSCLVCLEHGAVTGAVCQRLAQIAREASKHVDQARLAEPGSYTRIIGRGFINERKQFDVAGSKALEPADTITPGTLMVIVGGSRCRDDGDEGSGTTCKLHRPAVGHGHLSAKFGATF